MKIAAPMAQTTMSTVMGQSSKAVAAAMVPARARGMALVECSLVNAVIVYDPSSAWLNQ